MAGRPEDNLYCPVCREIFQDPVLLSCSHSFCRACFQTWWTKTTTQCPVCRRRVLHSDPPQNLALKNLCEAILQDRTRRLSAGSASAALCSLHSERLSLFCLDHQQPVCVVCLHSETHKNHNFKPIDEAARDYKVILQELLRPLQENEGLLRDVKANIEQTAKDIEVQARDTERQIQDVFATLREFLQKEEQARLSAVREEKLQKSQTTKKKMETLSRDIAALSDTIRATEQELRADNTSFLQNYKAAAERVQRPLPDVPEQSPGALIDVNKHLNNLSSAVLDKLKKMISPTVKPELLRYNPKSLEVTDLLSVLQWRGQDRRPSSFALPQRETPELWSRPPRKSTYPPPPPPIPAWRAHSPANPDAPDGVSDRLRRLETRQDNVTAPSTSTEDRRKDKKFKLPRK